MPKEIIKKENLGSNIFDWMLAIDFDPALLRVPKNLFAPMSFRETFFQHFEFKRLFLMHIYFTD